MLDSIQKSGKWNPADCLRNAFGAAPWFTLGVMYELTEQQWQRLVNEETFVHLTEDVSIRVKRVLRKYPMPISNLLDDGVTDVLLKLQEGRFLKRYDGSLGCPRPYMLGSAHQLARVIGRGFWRGYGRDNGLVPAKPKPPKPTLPPAHAIPAQE